MNQVPEEESIYALSSGMGKAGVAVIRLSGPRVPAALKAMCGGLTKARMASLRTITHPQTGAAIDRGLVIYFPAPHSFTGEAMAELHTHGARAVLDATFAALQTIGFRPAEAGEFTARAFRNGKLDLTQAEALADLIDSETEQQRQMAMGQLSGRLSRLAAGWRQRLLDCAVPLAAAIDFPDEGAVPLEIEQQSRPKIRALITELEQFLDQAHTARRVREGVSVVLLGAPNVGKSSLFNQLTSSEKAIVSDRPGTTRDMIEARLDIAGMAVTLIDTAGLREGLHEQEDAIEREGIRRAKARAAAADIKILILDAARWGRVATKDKGSDGVEIENYIAEQNKNDLVVWNKMDLATPPSQPSGLGLSLKTGVGLDCLRERLHQKITAMAPRNEAIMLTRQRHVYAVEQAISELKQALEMLDVEPELAAENVGLAARALARITGALDVEDVLGEIFSSFCIGK